MHLKMPFSRRVLKKLKTLNDLDEYTNHRCAAKSLNRKLTHTYMHIYLERGLRLNRSLKHVSAFVTDNEPKLL